MRSMASSALALALALLLAGCGPVDWGNTAADLAGAACRGVGNCSVVCGDGPTLDGRPAGARCRR